MHTRSLNELGGTQSQLFLSIDDPELLLQAINGATKQDIHQFLSKHFVPNSLALTKAHSNAEDPDFSKPQAAFVLYALVTNNVPGLNLEKMQLAITFLEQNELPRIKEILEVMVDVIAGKFQLLNQVLMSVASPYLNLSRVKFSADSGLATSLDFSDLNLAECTFSDCDLSNVNFSRAVLYKTNFSSCHLKGVNLSAANCKEARFIAANFESAMLTQTNFDDAHLTQASLQNLDLRKVTFRNAILLETNMSGSNLSSANFSGALLNKTVLSRTILDYAVFISASLSNINLISLTFTGTQFIGTNFDKVAVSDVSFSGTNFTHANLQGMRFAGASIRDVNFTFALLWGADFCDANIQNSHFAFAYFNAPEADISGTPFQKLNFSRATIQDTTFPDKCLKLNFTDAILKGADFSRRELSNVNFTRANLENANFTRSSFHNVDFTGASIGSVDFRKAFFHHVTFFKDVTTVEQCRHKLELLYSLLDFRSDTHRHNLRSSLLQDTVNLPEDVRRAMLSAAYDHPIFKEHKNFTEAHELVNSMFALFSEKTGIFVGKTLLQTKSQEEIQEAIFSNSP